MAGNDNLSGNEKSSVSRYQLCAREEIAEATGKEFEIEGKSYVVINHDHQLFAYTNVCPHIGTPLNWMPDQFLDRGKQYIQCASHGALFEIDSGHCIAGPCQGQHLQSVAVTIEQEQVFLHL